MNYDLGFGWTLKESSPYNNNLNQAADPTKAYTQCTGTVQGIAANGSVVTRPHCENVENPAAAMAAKVAQVNGDVTWLLQQWENQMTDVEATSSTVKGKIGGVWAYAKALEKHFALSETGTPVAGVAVCGKADSAANAATAAQQLLDDVV